MAKTMVFSRPNEQCFIRTNNVPMNMKVAILNWITVKKSTWSSTNVINIKNRNTAQLLTFLQHSPDLSVLLMFS